MYFGVISFLSLIQHRSGHSLQSLLLRRKGFPLLSGSPWTFIAKLSKLKIGQFNYIEADPGGVYI